MEQSSPVPGQAITGWWQKGMAAVHLPAASGAAIDLTAAMGFEPRFGGDADASGYRILHTSGKGAEGRMIFRDVPYIPGPLPNDFYIRILRNDSVFGEDLQAIQVRSGDNNAIEGIVMDIGQADGCKRDSPIDGHFMNSMLFQGSVDKF